MAIRPMYVWNGSEWVQIGDASTPQTRIDIAQSAPEGALVGSIWYDDESSGLYVFDGEYWVGIVGPQGPAGASGAAGPQGPQGIPGEPGESGIINVSYAASPTYTEEGSIWFDNTDPESIILKVYNGTEWIEVSGSGTSLKAHTFMTMGA